MPANKPKFKISYNCPVVLTYAAVFLVLVAVNALTGGWLNKYVMVCYGHTSLLDPLTYVRCITYFFGHSGWEHYASNMLLMLLVGPVVEEKYGSGNLAFMILVTGIASGIINCIFFDTGVITDVTKGTTYQAEPFAPFIKDMIARGGLMASLKAKEAAN